MVLKKNETLRKDDLFDSSSLMNPLSFNTPGLLFPAISLLMLAYTNRFLGLASLSRQLIGKFQENQNPDLLPQIRNLRFRLSLIRHTQSSGILSLLAWTSCLTALAFDFQGIAWSLFGTALFFLVISLCICLLEIHLSVQALDIEMHALYKPNSK
ncbi:PF11026 family protein [Leptospira interrogans serovar Valbuzzi str. Duyster]|uniref:DUF2721 domain-containing protein n=1 Tax=Leptospira interrogans TaxID=173 RepID=UPI0002B93B67|nr:DUF2721 domain-containing protein [Leptospira interrogans]EMJ57228.1 PF11026 family protein [Leptospira interrogans serovar Valbuzzi str. Duyster]ENO73487.1 PF11026 family protein [Leptospira interrogans serovar Valbuzzi str. Valbuzzi]